MPELNSRLGPTFFSRFLRKLRGKHELEQAVYTQESGEPGSKPSIPPGHVDVIHPALRAHATVLTRQIPRPPQVTGPQPSTAPRTSDRSVRLVMSNGSIRTYFPPRPQSAGGPIHRPLNMLMSVKTHHNPSLPPVWSASHDRAICALDTQNFAIPDIIKKLYLSFPELAAFIITSPMIDTRLQCLDQVPEIDYFKLGFLCTATGFISSYGANEDHEVDRQLNLSPDDEEGAGSVHDGTQRSPAIAIPINISYGPRPMSIVTKTPLSRISEKRDTSIDDAEIDILSRSPLSQLATNARSSRSRGEQARLSKLSPADRAPFASGRDSLSMSLSSSAPTWRSVRGDGWN